MAPESLVSPSQSPWSFFETVVGIGVGVHVYLPYMYLSYIVRQDAFFSFLS